MNVFALSIDPRAPTTVYAGTENGGVFKSVNGGESWRQLNTGLGNVTVYSLAMSSTGRCLHGATDSGLFSFAAQLDSECLPPPPLVAAVLPASRSVKVGTPATAFVSIVNSGVFTVEPSATASVSLGVEGVTCGVTQLTGAPTPFTFQPTDPATNLPIGTPNTPVNIAGGATQSFVISLTPAEEISPTDIEFGFNCTNPISRRRS